MSILRRAAWMVVESATMAFGLWLARHDYMGYAAVAAVSAMVICYIEGETRAAL